MEKDSKCEKVRIAICSGDLLTPDMQEHLSNCDECRSFRNEMQKLSNDLLTIDIPGIENGQITKNVMQAVHSEKHVSLPHFRIQNHIGTAAAILIIIAVFAANKGGRLLKSVTGTDITATDSVVSDTYIGDSEFRVIPSSGADTGGQSPDYYSSHAEAEDTKGETETAPIPESEKNESKLRSTQAPASTPAVQEKEVTASKSSPAVQSTDKVEFTPSAKAVEPAQSESNVVDSSNNEEVASSVDVSSEMVRSETEADFKSLRSDLTDSDYTYNNVLNQGDELSSSTADPDNNNDDNALMYSFTAPTVSFDKSDDDSQDNGVAENSVSDDNGYSVKSASPIFAGISFSDDNADYEANVNKANNYVSSLSETAAQISLSQLSSAGIMNCDFIIWLNSVYSPEQYSFEAIYDYFNK